MNEKKFFPISLLKDEIPRQYQNTMNIFGAVKKISQKKEQFNLPVIENDQKGSFLDI